MHRKIIEHRYMIVFALLLLIIGIGFFLNYDLKFTPDKVAQVITGSLTCIAIFFAACTFEYNDEKNIRDSIKSKESLTFNTAVEWHKPPIITYQSVLAHYQEELNPFIESKDGKAFLAYLYRPEKLRVRVALVSILNYFESIALGIDKKLIDGDFVKEFFETLFIEFYNDYLFYIEFRRKEIEKNEDGWKRFTTFAEKWKKALDTSTSVQLKTETQQAGQISTKKEQLSGK
jgi:hypothetical protein